MSGSRCAVVVVGALALALACCSPFSTSLHAQTIEEDIAGEALGHRSGTVVTTIDRQTNSALGGCGVNPFRASGAPGWSSSRGRVEFWLPPTIGEPSWWIATGLTLQGSAAGDEYGFALAGGGQFNGGPSDFVIGAPGSISDTGTVYAIAVNACGASAGHSILWTAAGGSAGERYGHALALIDDIDGDERDDVLVGAPYRLRRTLTASFPAAGYAYVLSGRTGVLLRSHGGAHTDCHLGWSVAGLGDLDGDGVGEYAVGEPGYDANATGGGTWVGAGLVRIYSGATGARLATRESTGTRAAAEHGAAVAAVGDVNGDVSDDYAVGAPGTNLGGSPFVIYQAGRFEVRSGRDGALLLASNGPSIQARLGASLAGGIDVLQDGVPDLVVGAPGYDNGRGLAQLWSMRTRQKHFEVFGDPESELGAYVGLEHDVWITGMPGRLGDRGGWRTYAGVVDWRVLGRGPGYGASVALLDDVDADGWDDFAVGQYDPSVSFSLPSWDVRSGRTSGILHAFDELARHGHTVGSLGDVNGDGQRDFAHARPYEGTVELRSGAAPRTVLRAHTLVVGTLYGHVVVDAGDTDGDGASDYLVAEPLASGSAGSEVGRVHLYSGRTGTLVRTHEGPAPGGQLGLAACGLGDVDGDGYADYGAGAPFADNFIVVNGGRVFLWSGRTGAALLALSGSSSGGGPLGTGGQLGRALCSPGDLNGDGRAEIAVGEPFWHTGGAYTEGRVRVLAGGPAGSAFSVLHEFRGQSIGQHSYAGWALAAIGDADLDGLGDLAYSFVGSSPGVSVRSGRTGWQLFGNTYFGTFLAGGLYGNALAGYGGTHDERRYELLVGAPSPTGLGGIEMIFLPRASSGRIGSGCGRLAAPQPSLEIDPPLYARLYELRLASFPATASPVALYLSLPSAISIPFGFGCELHLDPASMFYLSLFAVNSRTELFTPEDPLLVGLGLHFQGFAFDAQAPLSLHFTNAVSVRIGH